MSTKTITLSTSKGPTQVDAEIVGHLAYHRLPCSTGLSSYRWVVTHVASGLTIFPGYDLALPTSASCLVFIEQVKDLVDWSKSAGDLWAQYGDRDHPPAAIAAQLRDAYSKALGKAIMGMVAEGDLTMPGTEESEVQL